MAELLIQLNRRRDGNVVLRCIRADGSVTWQKQEGRYAGFFPMHDLTHYAVEMVLGLERGFYGLIANGWEIEETTGKGGRGPLPPEAGLAEQIVGFLDAERAGGARWSALEFNDHLAGAPTTAGMAQRPQLSEADLAKIREMVRGLWERWMAVVPGETLELSFSAVKAK